jgi:hypothetical protein
MRIMLAIITILFSSQLALSSQTYKSTFDSETEGWTGINFTIAWNYLGNPGGCLEGVDTGCSFFSPGCFFVSPASWSGNWINFIGGKIEYDLKVGANLQGYDLALNSYAGSLYWTSVIRPTPGTWTHFALQLRPETFNVTENYFRECMENIISLEIKGGEFNYIADISYLDNVQVRRPKATIPFPLILE